VSVALVTQHAKDMCHIIFSSVVSLAVPYFSIFSHKRYYFRKSKLLNIKCVFFIFSTTLSKTFLILRRIRRDITINVHRSSCKMPDYSGQILMKIEFSRQMFEKYSNIKFRENPFSGSLVVPCRRTDRHDEANFRFSQFLRKAPKIVKWRHAFIQRVEFEPMIAEFKLPRCQYSQNISDRRRFNLFSGNQL
jgi:hypothetical protein